MLYAENGYVCFLNQGNWIVFGFVALFAVAYMLRKHMQTTDREWHERKFFFCQMICSRKSNFIFYGKPTAQQSAAIMHFSDWDAAANMNKRELNAIYNLFGLYKSELQSMESFCLQYNLCIIPRKILYMCTPLQL